MLTPRVFEMLGLDAILIGASLLDGILDSLEQPLTGLATIIRLIVAGVKACQLLEMFLHFGF